VTLITNDPMPSLRPHKAVNPNKHNKNSVLHKVPIATTEEGSNPARSGANTRIRSSSNWTEVQVNSPCAELIKHYAIYA
jgi:hypothetical protein